MIHTNFKNTADIVDTGSRHTTDTELDTSSNAVNINQVTTSSATESSQLGQRSITSRAQLSPNAKIIDTLLFGNPIYLSPEDRNPLSRRFYTYGIDMSEIIAEISAFRGNALTELIATGQKVHESFAGKVSKDIELFIAQDQPLLKPFEKVICSLLTLRNANSYGEQGLTKAELQLRANSALESTLAKTLAPISSTEKDQIYVQALIRAEVFESKPTKPKITREAFESWKEQQFKELLQEYYRTQLLLIKSELENNNLLAVLEVYDSNKHGVANTKIKSLPWKEYQKLLIPFNADECYARIKNSSSYEYPRIQLKLPSNRAVVYYEPPYTSGTYTPLFNGYRSDSEITGKLDPRPVAVAHYNRLLLFIATRIYEVHSKLMKLNYQTFVNDNGESFRNYLTKQHYQYQQKFSEDSTPQYLTQEDVFKTACWGRFSEGSNFWTKQGSSSSVIFRIWNLSAKFIGLCTYDLIDIRPRQLEDCITKPPSKIKSSLRKLGSSAMLLVGALSMTLSTEPGWKFFNSLLRSVNRNNIHKVVGSNEGNAHNKILAEIDDKILFKLTSTGKLPNRFSLGDPSQASFNLYFGDDNFNKFIINSEVWLSGDTSIPRAEHTFLKSLKIRNASTNEVWEEGRDYTLRRTIFDEPIIFPSTNQPFHFTAEYNNYNNTSNTEAKKIIKDKLKSLPNDKINELAKELKDNGFTYLPDILDALVTKSEAQNIPISIYDLEYTLRATAFYSQISEKRMPLLARLLNREFTKAARFLNSEGISCYQCDGAQELAVSIFKKLFSGTEIEVIPRTVMVISKDNTLTAASPHADIKLYDPKSGQSFVMDTVPDTIDPRDTIPHPKDFPRAHSPDPDRVTTEAFASVIPSEPPLNMAVDVNYDVPLPETPYRAVILSLFKTWEQALMVRQKAKPVQHRTFISADLEPSERLTGINIATQTSPELFQNNLANNNIGSWVFDPALLELDLKFSAVVKALQPLKILNKSRDRIPTEVLLIATKLTRSFLSNKIDENNYKKAISSFLPNGSSWPSTTDQGEIAHSVVSSIWKHTERIYNLHVDNFIRSRTKNYPQLLNPQLRKAFNELGQFVSTHKWKSPVWVTEQDRNIKS